MKKAFVCGCGVAIVFFFFFVMSKSPQRLIEELEKEINRILNDELLKDVNLAMSTEELDALIAVEQEQAYRIKIERESLKPISNVCFMKRKTRQI